MTPEERAGKVVNELDDLAREVDGYDYGLPVYGENMASLVAVVAAAIREAVAEERERCAKIADNPPGVYSMDDVDATAKVAAAIRDGRQP